ncbi:MAK10-like protein [Tanacetum coccineum]
MGDKNPIRTLGNYSKPSHEGYRNTIELPEGNNVVPLGPLRPDTIRLVQNVCFFHGIRSENPNQHLKDFLKLVDSLDLNVENRQRTRLRLFQFSLRDQASNWLERLPAGSISTWEDLTTRFLAQFFPPGRTAKLLPHHGIDIWLQVQIFYDHVNPTTRRTIDQSAGGKLRDRNIEESWALLEDLALYDNESWNDPRDFAKPVKAISLPQDVPSTSDRRLIELENQVQCLMEAHIAPKQPIQVNKITFSCEICSGPHDTQYCMENPEQAFVDYASSRTDEAGGKWYTFKPEQNNLGDTYNPSWKSHPNLRVLKAITDRITRALPSDTVKNQKLNVNSTSPVLSTRSYPMKDPQCSSQEEEEKCKPENININPPSPPDPTISLITEKENDGDVMFIEIIRKYDDSREEELEEDKNTMTKGLGVEYFDIFPTKSELAYHKSEEDKRRGVDYVMSKILGFYKECLELGPEYLTGLEDEGGVT